MQLLLIKDAEIYAQSLPNPVLFALNVDSTKRIADAKKNNLDNLTKAGFQMNFEVDESDIERKYKTRGDEYHIDVECSQLIIDDKINVVQSPGGIDRFEKHALVLADGRKLDADIVVLATGYDNMRTSVRKILGDKVAARLSGLNRYANRVSLCRCGVPAGTQPSGSCVGISRFVGSILESWRCRPRLLRRDFARMKSRWMRNR